MCLVISARLSRIWSLLFYSVLRERLANTKWSSGKISSLAWYLFHRSSKVWKSRPAQGMFYQTWLDLGRKMQPSASRLALFADAMSQGKLVGGDTCLIPGQGQGVQLGSMRATRNQAQTNPFPSPNKGRQQTGSKRDVMVISLCFSRSCKYSENSSSVSFIETRAKSQWLRTNDNQPFNLFRQELIPSDMHREERSFIN